MYQLQPWMAQFGQMGGMQPGGNPAMPASPMAALMAGQGGLGPMSQFAPPQMRGGMGGGMGMPMGAPMQPGARPGLPGMVGQLGQNGQGGTGILGLLQNLHGFLPPGLPGSQFQGLGNGLLNGMNATNNPTAQQFAPGAAPSNFQF